MHPPVKDQTDIGRDNPGLDASDEAISETYEGDVVENKDMTQQQWKEEADINYMLSRFNIVPPKGAPTFGEWDDNINLQTAIQATREARTAWRKVPKELQQKFSNMDDLLAAVESGQLRIKEEPDEPVPPAPQPPA